ncbi:MAG TPA: ATP-binding protein [Gemmatimonadaceae bacterium]|jgi:signal transduction histidine kinase/response regulator RpfG family c-di-GMP phosphodiesterase
MTRPSQQGTERYTTLARYVRRAKWTLALVIGGIVVTLLIARTNRVRSAADELRGRTVTRLTLSAELAAATHESAIRLAFVTGDSLARERSNVAKRELTVMLDSVRATAPGDTRVLTAVSGIDSALARWEAEFVDGIPIGSIGVHADTMRLHLRRGDSLFSDVRRRFADLLAGESAATVTRVETSRLADTGSLLLFLAECAVLAFIVFQLMRELRSQVGHAADAHRTITGQNTTLVEQRDQLQSQTMQLQEQAAELEVQQADLQAQTVELETTLEELRSVEDRERELAEKTRQLNQRLIEAQQVAQIGYFEVDSTTGDVFWSDEMYRLCGLEPAYDEIAPPTDFYLSCVHPDDRTRMSDVARHAMEQQSEFTEQYRLRGPGGKMQTVLAKGRVIVDAQRRRKLVGTVQNITDRVQLENQLRQSQKMQAVGTLAGGVAHDFNNVLTVILSYSGIMLSDMQEGDPNFAELTEISRAAERAGDLTRQLLTFSRQQVVQTRELSVNAVVSDVERMLRRIIPANISLVLRLNPHVATVQADSGQLEQILVNLVVNARDAMPDGGAIAIETSNVLLERSQPPLSPGAEGGMFVMLVVTDTGIGMDDAVRARIFEPFYTTKEVGKGTGLGLATVYGIVQQSGGHIWVYSEPGVGTTFKIYFPALRTAAVTRNPSAARVLMSPGSETILLTEDEGAVRMATRTILEQAGYKVIEAANGHLALDTFRKRADEIDLVITDMIMPGMNGRELADQIRDLRPDVRLLFTSGYTDDTVLRQSLLQAGSLFIQKPYTPQNLTAKVREALSARA